MLNFEGKVAIITGCGSSGPGWGNGKATAVVLAKRGATVFGVDINTEAATETKKLIEDAGGSCKTHAADVTNPEQSKGIIDECLKQFGRIDVLINNVGQSEPGGPVDMELSTWNAQLALNLTSAFLTCKWAIPVMEKQGGGAIVNVASIAGLRYIGKPQVGYSAAKAGLLQFTRATAVIHAGKGVRLNCVVPGIMFTPLVVRLADRYAKGDFEGFVAHRHQQPPMGRMGDAWDIAYAAAFLASDEAKYITGTEIVVDGGITAATR